MDALDEDGEPQRKTLSPHVELPYIYFAAWYVLHCPVLMSMTRISLADEFIPFVQRLEDSTWNGGYLVAIRKIVQSSMNYQIFCCFPEIKDDGYGDQFADSAGPDGFTKLPSGVFWWLVNIRPGYLVFRQWNY